MWILIKNNINFNHFDDIKREFFKIYKGRWVRAKETYFYRNKFSTQIIPGFDRSFIINNDYVERVYADSRIGVVRCLNCDMRSSKENFIKNNNKCVVCHNSQFADLVPNINVNIDNEIEKCLDRRIGWVNAE